jgi:hypothetical protein
MNELYENVKSRPRSALVPQPSVIYCALFQIKDHHLGVTVMEDKRREYKIHLET